MAGNTTFISVVEDEKVDEVIGIIAKHSRRRTQVVPSTSTMDVGMYSSFPGGSHRGRLYHFRAERRPF